MTSIPVIYSFARSGGTLVNQLLGATGNCIVLSEANPSRCSKAIHEQAVEWFDLLSVSEGEELAKRPYHQQIEVLSKLATEQDMKLVIRDWSTVNFLPNAVFHSPSPSLLLEQQIYLERAGFAHRPLVIARRGDHVYESIKTNFPLMKDLTLEEFAFAYLAYARAVCKFPRVHLEMLRHNPKEGVTEILQILELDGVPSFLLENFSKYRKCTGNNTLKVENESSQATSILDNVPDSKSNYQDVTEIAEANELLGYA